MYSRETYLRLRSELRADWWDDASYANYQTLDFDDDYHDESDAPADEIPAPSAIAEVELDDIPF